MDGPCGTASRKDVLLLEAIMNDEALAQTLVLSQIKEGQTLLLDFVRGDCLAIQLTHKTGFWQCVTYTGRQTSNHGFLFIKRFELSSWYDLWLQYESPSGQRYEQCLYYDAGSWPRKDFWICLAFLLPSWDVLLQQVLQAKARSRCVTVRSKLSHSMWARLQSDTEGGT